MRAAGFFLQKLRVGETLFRATENFAEEYAITDIISLRFDCERFLACREDAEKAGTDREVFIRIDLDEDFVIVHAKMKEAPKPKSITTSEMFKMGFGIV